ncbi:MULTISPECIES: hypothetical protein [unclassified Nocardiopsis]|uniref:hypothetical protein n=1 Tax=unclassified Nocardiopsis TaxID=2649073 RepID=UPI00135AAB54|nr:MULTISPECIES: hypothetical protein [unclassified Nocardiopsis]
MARIDLDRRAIDRLSRNVTLMGPELSLAARRVALAARASELPGRKRTRAFRRGVTQTRPALDGPTVAVRVGSRWSLAHLWEFGSINTPTTRPLSRAAQSVGLRVEGR